MFYVYVLRCKDDDSFYLGFTSNLEQRVNAHNNEQNISTAGRKWVLVYYEAYVSESYARKRENNLKKNRRMKQLLLKRVHESL